MKLDHFVRINANQPLFMGSMRIPILKFYSHSVLWLISSLPWSFQSVERPVFKLKCGYFFFLLKNHSLSHNLISWGRRTNPNEWIYESHTRTGRRQFPATPSCPNTISFRLLNNQLGWCWMRFGTEPNSISDWQQKPCADDIFQIKRSPTGFLSRSVAITSTSSTQKSSQTEQRIMKMNWF